MPPLRGAGGRELEFPGGPWLPCWPPSPTPPGLCPLPRSFLRYSQEPTEPRAVKSWGPRPASGAPARPQAPALLSGSTDVSVSHDDHVSVEFSSTRFPVRLPPRGWAFEGAREPRCRVGLGERRAPRLALAPGDTHSAPRAARLCTRTPRCSCGRPFPRPLARGSGVELRGSASSRFSLRRVGRETDRLLPRRPPRLPPASPVLAEASSCLFSFLFFPLSPPPLPHSFFRSRPGGCEGHLAVARVSLLGGGQRRAPPGHGRRVARSEEWPCRYSAHWEPASPLLRAVSVILDTRYLVLCKIHD